ncbi:MAG: alpha/beta fold hydrolase [Halioglobus sp.]
MRVNIHSSQAGDGPAVILLHGLFGMGSNLAAMSRALQDNYCVYSLDLPNHGRSGWVQSIDTPAMATAILGWMDEQGISIAALVGHSLGGKVAMTMALQQPQRVSALVVADIAPVQYGSGHEREFAALQAVASAGCQSRKEAHVLMSEYLDNEAVIQFLLKNLVRQADGCYSWRFNLPGIVAGYGAVRAAVASTSPYQKPVLFIKGGDSDYIQEKHRDQIMSLFPQTQLKVMPGCGHWLHVENPRLFNSLVGRYLDDQIVDS